MNLDAQSCYRALVARDARFDGRFFVGVTTTGIYCRTICPARTPRQDRCLFFVSAAAAEQAGFRPCLRCRPERAPGCAPVDSAGRLAGIAYRRIEEGALEAGGIAALAEEMQVSDRHLRRVLRAQYGVAPARIAQTQRLLLARRLLADTRLPITEVALASGFASVRRFNAVFHERYRQNPSALRRNHSASAGGVSETITCRLAYRPPLDWPALLGFLRARAIRGVESVSDTAYRRTVHFGAHRGWIEVGLAAGGANRAALLVTLPAEMAPVLLPALSSVQRLFDLGADPVAIGEALGELAATRPGLRVPGAVDGYELAIRAILGQQVSVRAATTLASRYAAAFGEPVVTPFADLTHLTPTPAAVARAAPEQLTALGITGSRARSILTVADAVAAGTLDLRPGADPESTRSRLLSLPGIGQWTAEYICMRALSDPDAFPHTDLGLYRALGTRNPREALARAERWRPWRAYAALHLWHTPENLT